MQSRAGMVCPCSMMAVASKGSLKARAVPKLAYGITEDSVTKFAPKLKWLKDQSEHLHLAPICSLNFTAYIGLLEFLQGISVLVPSTNGPVNKVQVALFLWSSLSSYTQSIIQNEDARPPCSIIIQNFKTVIEH